jgi:hypothetical protein
LARIENSSRELSPYLVLFRFCVRIVILIAFAVFGGVGFGASMAALFAMASILCTAVATVRRETVFSRGLNHWDEAIAYAALYFMIVAFDLSPPL